MKLLVFTIFCCSLFFSCNSVVFETPQPEKGRALSAMPKMYEGLYSHENIEVEVKRNTLKINGQLFNITRDLPGNDQVQLRFANNMFFANFSYRNPKSFLSVFMFQFFENKMAIYMLNPDLRSLSRVMRFAPVETEDIGSIKYHIVKPKKNNFFELVDNELFDVVAVLERLAD